MPPRPTEPESHHARFRAGRSRAIALLLVASAAAGAARAAEQKPPPAEAGDLYELGRQLFEQLATAEMKEQFAFPTKAEWDAFAARLQQALDGDSLETLASYLPEARAAATALRLLGDYDDLADWLEQRIDEVEGARQATAPAAPATYSIPYYDLWLARVRERPLPAAASTLVPKLRAAFVTEGLPPELVWLAEAESSFNPRARSPSGAKGLFQFMPETAQAHGLSTFLPDERTDPEKSARAAARHLRALHAKFGNWPLALAAYNAGEGRIARTLTARKARDFSGIADALPAETRMYVPKVCALIATRAGVTPDRLAAPRR